MRAVNESLSVNSIDIINRINEYKNIVRGKKKYRKYVLCKRMRGRREKDIERGVIYRTGGREGVGVF